MLSEHKEKLKSDGKVIFGIKIKPGAETAGLNDYLADGTIKISIIANPEKGAANDELMKLLAAEFAVPRGNVKIIKGKKSRNKLIKITT